MVDWAVVAAYIGPLVTAIGLAAGLFAWLGNKREARIGIQIREVVSGLESNQQLLAQRISQVESNLEGQTRHLDRQDAALTTAMQAVARIEGRLAGPITLAPPPA